MAGRPVSHDYSYPPMESGQDDVVTSGPYGYAFQVDNNQGGENGEQSAEAAKDKAKNMPKRRLCFIIVLIILGVNILITICCLVLLLKGGSMEPTEKQTVNGLSDRQEKSALYNAEKSEYRHIPRNRLLNKIEKITNKIDRTRRLRIVGGKTKKEGRVEVLHNGEWGTICDDNWGLKEARIVCEILGYSKALTAPVNAYFGRGSGRIWLDDISCIGIEADIVECVHSDWGKHNCQHDEDASVTCE